MRSSFVRSRKRIAAGHTPGEPMLPRTVRFFDLYVAKHNRDFAPDIDADHGDAAFLAGEIEHVGERSIVAGRLDYQVRAAPSGQVFDALGDAV